MNAVHRPSFDRHIFAYLVLAAAALVAIGLPISDTQKVGVELVLIAVAIVVGLHANWTREQR